MQGSVRIDPVTLFESVDTGIHRLILSQGHDILIADGSVQGVVIIIQAILGDEGQARSPFVTVFALIEIFDRLLPVLFQDL